MGAKIMNRSALDYEEVMVSNTKSLMDRMEVDVACGEISASQLFTKMRQAVNSLTSENERLMSEAVKREAENERLRADNSGHKVRIEEAAQVIRDADSLIETYFTAADIECDARLSNVNADLSDWLFEYGRSIAREALTKGRES